MSEEILINVTPQGEAEKFANHMSAKDGWYKRNAHERRYP